MDIIVALYNNIAYAQQTAEELIESGIPSGDVYLIKWDADRIFQQLRASGEKQEEVSELRETLKRLDIPREQASAAREEIRYGGGAVAVRVDGGMRDRVLETIQRPGLVDVTALHSEDEVMTLRLVMVKATTGDFSSDTRAAFKRHFQARYAPKGFSYETYEPGYRFGYILGREMSGQNVSWESEWPRIKERWQKRYRGDWRQFAPAVKQGWLVGQGLDPGREPHVSEIQGTKRTAQYRELLEAQ